MRQTRGWTTTRAVSTIALALAVGAGTTACSVRDSNASAGILTRTLPSEGEMTAIIGGTLAIDARGCVLVSGSPVVWPAGTTLAADPPAIQLPGGQVVRPGQLVSGGGGEIPSMSIRQTNLRIDGDLDAALECAPETAHVKVFNARGASMAVAER